MRNTRMEIASITIPTHEVTQYDTHNKLAIERRWSSFPINMGTIIYWKNLKNILTSNTNDTIVNRQKHNSNNNIIHRLLFYIIFCKYYKEICDIILL